MLTLKLEEAGRTVEVTCADEDRAWDVVVEDVVVFLHACGYVFDPEDVVATMEEKKEELQTAEIANQEGVPF